MQTNNRANIFAFLPYIKLTIAICCLTLSTTLFSQVLISPNKIQFQYTGHVQAWEVPSCVFKIRLEAWGAQGGSSLLCTSNPDSHTTVQNDGGLGGYVTGEYDVTPGQKLYIYVGGQGAVGASGIFDGGFNGGGDGGLFGGGGGGASDIRTIIKDLDYRILVAGGGGGGNSGGPDAGTGGAGGGLIGHQGIQLFVFGPGGGGGTQVFGGAPGGSGGEMGLWGIGGSGGEGDDQFHIAGGGGGWYGGGSAYASGGGGGSSNLGGLHYTLTNASTQDSVHTGNGLIHISLINAEDCASCPMTCANLVNVAMSANECYTSLSPEDVLVKLKNQCTTFGFNVTLSYPFGTHVLNGNDVDRSHVNYTMVYTVSDGVSNSCWGYIKVEDKSAPILSCHGTQRVSCYQLATLLSIKTQVIDNCSANNKASIENLLFTDFGCDNVLGIGRINRTLRATDAWGNSSSCSDTIFILKDSIKNTMDPDFITLNCKLTCKTDDATAALLESDYEDIFFSKDPASQYYPSPELLIRLQQSDTFNSSKSCIPDQLKLVPFIYDSVFVWKDGEYVKELQRVNQYPFKSGYCKIITSYNDEVIPTCGGGSSFKIRREWRIKDWCTDEEKTIIQYIEIADKNAPTLFLPNGGSDARDDRLVYRAFVEVHSCYATVDLKALVVEDCSSDLVQQFSVVYDEVGHPGTKVVQSGNLPGKVKLPAVPGVYGARCFPIRVTVTDACYNHLDTVIQVCVLDETPPEVLAHEATRVTVDPTTCWSRIYAKDLDNGSHDNCCDVLHFAVATMDSIESANKYVYDAIIAQCGWADYKASQEYYDFYIEDYISSYIFKDYVDLNACGTYRVVLRVWEACGIPRYDPHIWPCSEHLWYMYNVGYPRSHYRADHNLNFGFSVNADYSKFKAPKDCNWRYPLIFCDPLLKDWFAIAGLDDYHTAYIGAGAAELCNFSFYWPRLGQMTAGNNFGSNIAPGNTCSRMLHKDAMVMVTVDDKTPPVADNPDDIFWYCDNVSSLQAGQYEYAQCLESDGCTDTKGNPYNEIECRIENDGILSDTVDPTGKPFGWYGCNLYAPNHVDEHGVAFPCLNNEYSWSPVYCHSWLCLDSLDQAGQINPYTLFSMPSFKNGSPTQSAGKGRFWIWDNCHLDTSSLKIKDTSILDKCGNGWLSRTWTVADQCGNKVTVDQKIVVKHRSDFEVVFPKDITLTCENGASLTNDIIGKPIISDDECELVGITFTDELFDIVPDACYKIIRTWKLIDWCKYEPNNHQAGRDVIVDDRLVADTLNRPCVYRNVKDNGDGIVQYVQIIKVVDHTPPMATSRDTIICINDVSCTSPFVQIPCQATDNCTDQAHLAFRWELDENPSAADLAAKKYNPASIDKKSASSIQYFTGTRPIGTALVHVIAADKCGNEDTTTFVLTVKDCKKPTPYCFNGIATVIMPSTGKLTLWASDLNAGSYDNCTLSKDLRFSFSSDSAQHSKEYSCTDMPNGRDVTLPISIYVWDNAGLSDLCNTYILLQDGIGNVCPDVNGLTGGGLKNPHVINKVDFDGNTLTNHPNPFHVYTIIDFTLPQDLQYTITITDLSGRKIMHYDAIGNKGMNHFTIHPADLKGAGLYFYTLETSTISITKKMILTN